MDSTEPKPAPETTDEPAVTDAGEPIRVVGLGASAGGLEALELFFSHLPNDTGMAFVVIQHLSPDFKSVMDELLSRRTRMPVRMAEDGMRVEPNGIFLLPRKTQMRIEGGRLRLEERDSTQALLLPIDTFFESLAIDCGEQAVGIILSGTGSDGSRGIRAIHQEGGLVFAQTEESAKFDGMPRAAADTAIVDFLLPPERMPEVLIAYAGAGATGRYGGFLQIEESEFAAVFSFLKGAFQIDFSSYKPTTMRRRIERRMALRKIPTLPEYAEILRTEQEELEALYIDLLIGVTRFFRDEAAFDLIRQSVVPQLLAEKGPGEELRAWVCGCATGQEAYSVAIILAEAAAQLPDPPRLKVFATDVHRRTLDHAARGIYSTDDVKAVPRDFLERHFIAEGETYRVRPELRQMVVFSEHNLTDDPPFTKIDLISCRNLLIYLQNSAQHKAISLFHFALNVGGVLMLGPSESLGNLTDEFNEVNRHWKIYQKRRDVRVFANLREYAPPIGSGRVVLASGGGVRQSVDARLARAYDNLLGKFMPPSVLVDESRRVLHSFAEAGQYFVPMQGRPSFDLVDMLSGDLRAAVAAALQRSIKESRKITYQSVVAQVGESSVRLNLTITPIPDRIAGSSLYHIVFEEQASRPIEVASEGEVVEEFGRVEASTQQRIRDLELELQYSKEHLQTTVEELETSNEELQATNEELLASNEELQSTNEELHSVNEELYTVNAEYEKKNRELFELNIDIDNLLQSTDIGTLFLDRELEVRKFTPAIRIAFNLLPQDVGRSIADITYRIVDHKTLWEDASEVMRTQCSIDHRVRSVDHRELLLRLRPYRVSPTESAGVVLTFVDITDLVEAQRRLAESEERFRRVANSTPLLLWMVEDTLGGTYFNDHWTVFTGENGEALRQDGWMRCVNAEDLLAFREQFDRAKSAGREIVSEMRIRNATGDWRWMRLTGSPRRLDDGSALGYIFSAIDIDDIRNASDRLREEVDLRTRELRTSEEFFRVVGETATDGYWDWNLSTQRIFLSSSFKALFGYRDDEMQSSVAAWRAIIHPDDRETVDRAVKQHLEEGTPLDLVVRYLHKDQSLRWVILRGAAVRNRHGVFDRMIGTHTDITAQKEAEAQIRASEKRFRSVFETRLTGIGMVDADYSLTEANGTLLRIIGRSREELPIELKHISTAQGLEVSRHLILEARALGVSTIREKTYRHADGKLVTARLGYGLLDDTTGELVVIAQDISSEKAWVEALRRSEERLAQAVEATQVGLFDWEDPAEDQLWCTPELFRLFGLEPRQDLVSIEHFLDRVHPEDIDAVRNGLHRTVESGDDFDHDFRILLPGGKTRWIFFHAKMIQPEGETRRRLVGTGQDVTERYASQLSLKMKTELLEKSNRDLEQFAYIASHDLKEPLRTVTGYLQILQSRFGDQMPGEAGEFSLRAVHAAERMHALIDGLLEFSRIGRMDLKVEPVDLNEVVAMASGQLQAAIEEKGAEVSVESLPTVNGDQTLVERVFLNLFSNSIKFSGEKAPQIRVWAETDEREVRVYVEDNGIGINPRFGDRVFVIFQRLHTREEYPGTGIGLSVCRKIMERMGGRIWMVERAEGAVGTVFAVAFPRFL